MLKDGKYKKYIVFKLKVSFLDRTSLKSKYVEEANPLKQNKGDNHCDTIFWVIYEVEPRCSTRR